VRDHLEHAARPYDPARPSPTAYWVGQSAIHRFERTDFVDRDSFEPAYLRPFHTNERKPIFNRAPD
jgi:hypothetical protein